MLLRGIHRKKDGKDRRNFSIVGRPSETERSRAAPLSFVRHLLAGVRVVAELGLQCRSFGMHASPGRVEDVPWEKVLQLMVGEPPARSWQRVSRAPPVVHAHRKDTLLGIDFAVAEKHRLYRCLDRVLDQMALSSHLHSGL